ncbi:hypothetical protein ACWDSJ_06275 [Nocardia sp. NPDC003482]
MKDESGTSEIAALAQRVATARGKLPLQSDPALFDELSEAELAAERELAEWIRAQRRRQRRRAVAAELTAEKRDRRVALSVRRAEDADLRWHRRALAARRRVSSPDARLAQLYRRAEWSSRALIGVVVLGMLWAGVNVQHNLVPSGDMRDPLYWLSYGFEAMISIPIITIMVVATTAARWGREIARGKVVFLEAALLGVTIALNAGPHLVSHAPARAAEAAVAPVMVGVVIWLHAWVSARYAQLIDAVPLEDRDAESTVVTSERADVADGFGSAGLALTSGYATGGRELGEGYADVFPGPYRAPEPVVEYNPEHREAAETTGRNGHAHTEIRTSVAGAEPNSAASHGRNGHAHPSEPSEPVLRNGHRIPNDQNPTPARNGSHNGHPVLYPLGAEPGGDVAPKHTAAEQISERDDSDRPDANDATPPPGSTGKDRAPKENRPTSKRTAGAEHPYTRRPLPAPEPETGRSRTHEAIDRATQLVLDDAPLDPPSPRRAYPVAAPAPVAVNPDDEIDPEPPTEDDTDYAAEIDDVEVWAVAREISERGLSKLPVEQLAEILTLADESWTPVAIGANIGLPGSRILGILDAARKIRRPYAISG